jgi:hypothetical protein
LRPGKFNTDAGNSFSLLPVLHLNLDLFLVSLLKFLTLLLPPEQRGDFAIKPDKLSERSEFLSGRKNSALHREPVQRARHWGAFFLLTFLARPSKVGKRRPPSVCPLPLKQRLNLLQTFQENTQLLLGIPKLAAILLQHMLGRIRHELFI